MGNCRIFGREKELRDVNGHTPRSIAFSSGAIDKWRRRQELLKKESVEK